MTRPVAIDPAKLVDAADALVDHHIGRAGRPRAVYLRRAVSTAYYGLYHCVCLEAARTLIPSAPPTQQMFLARAFGHREVKTCCEWIAGRRGGTHRYVVPLVRALKQSEFVDVADSFCDLQEARHQADYDHLASFSKATANSLVAEARFAIAAIESASADEREAFFALLAIRAKMA